ncbi:DGQHR domain-containing protein [Vibrio parahaemolyticus]|jgi:DGQHR domain-containing protein
MPKIKIDAIKIEQPIGEFFFGKMTARELMKISYSDVRRLEDEERGVEKYLGIQRPLKKDRVKDINSYISTIDATFPNSIILAINEEHITWESGELIVSYNKNDMGNIAKILDGQHRLAGFDEQNYTYLDFEGNEKEFELLVTIFVKADMSVQAKIFSMVNQNQTKVNKSLVYDLESLAETRSPWKTGHSIAVYLNSSEKSPFFRRIKRLGVKSHSSEPEPLTQAAFVENLVKLISPNAQEDRNIIMGKDKGFLGFKSKSLPNMDTESLCKFPFRKPFSDDKDEIILKVVFDYFKAVERIWPVSWDKNTKDSVLNKTVGLIAMFRLLGYILQSGLKNGDITLDLKIPADYLENRLRSLDVTEDYFNSFDAVSKSSSRVFKELSAKLV